MSKRNFILLTGDVEVNMSDSVFRKVSLERLSSPEELDQLIKVTRPKGWIALIAVGCILGTALVWGIFGNIPTKTNGQGIITASEGVLSIMHPGNGIVSDVRVRTGDYVNKGDIIARVEVTDRVEQINALKEQLQLVKEFDADKIDENKDKLSTDLSPLYDMARSIKQQKASNNVKQTVLDDRLNSVVMDIKKTEMLNRQYSNSVEQSKIKLQMGNDEVKNAKTNYDTVKILFAEELASKKDLEDAEKLLQSKSLQLKSYEQDFEIAKSNAASAQIDLEQKRKLSSAKDSEKAQLTEAQLNLVLLYSSLEVAKTAQINEINKKIEENKAKLEAESTVVANTTGRILEVSAKKGDIIAPGVQIASMVKENPEMNTMEVVLYMPPGEGKKVKAGMSAQISPTVAKKEDYGVILGSVVSVSDYPVSIESMIKTLGSKEIATMFAANGAPIEVHINLALDKSTVSGFKWTTAKGAPMKIGSGNICFGSILVESKRPIQMVIPLLKEKLNIY